MQHLLSVFKCAPTYAAAALFSPVVTKAHPSMGTYDDYSGLVDKDKCGQRQIVVKIYGKYVFN